MTSKLSYLQKYYIDDASDNKESTSTSKKQKKKKRKKDREKSSKSSRSSRMEIIDEEDDFPLASSKVHGKKGGKDDEMEEQMLETKEEQPQIAGIVDERPEMEIIKERFVTNAFLPVVKVEEDNNDLESPRVHDDLRVKREPVSDDEETSATRRRRYDSDSDHSPPRRRPQAALPTMDKAENPKRSQETRWQRRRHDSSDSDQSPPRKRTSEDSKQRAHPKVSRTSRRHDSDSDQSPPRKRTSEDSKQRAHLKVSRTGRRHDSDSDQSPPRRSPVRIKREASSDLSPPRRSSTTRKQETGSKSPMATTLDGKKAGLQKAAHLKDELNQIRKNERDMFENMSREVSGRGAETQVRGRLKAKEEEKARKEKEFGITDEIKEKYKQWSKGLKQVEASRERFEADQYEMSKPLARDADDVDLDAHLKAIEREEDPMLNYLRKKKAKMSGNKEMPKYKGPMPAPNRFGIAPGYRWDGVDRSNGFEKRLFERRNRAKAVSEEAHMWSIADM